MVPKTLSHTLDLRLPPTNNDPQLVDILDFVPDKQKANNSNNKRFAVRFDSFVFPALHAGNDKNFVALLLRINSMK